MKCTIVADNREKSSGVPALLSAMVNCMVICVIKLLRGCNEINSPHLLALSSNNFVKNSRRSSAMPAFFASFLNKISSHISIHLFRYNP